MAKHEDFLVLSPQQYILIYGVLAEKLVEATHTMPVLDAQQNEINTVKCLNDAQTQNELCIDGYFQKGWFSRRERNQAIEVNREVKFCRDMGIILDSTFKLGLWCMANKGYFSFDEYANSLKAVECHIAIKGYETTSKAFKQFKYDSVFGEDLIQPNFIVERAKGDSEHLADIGRAMSAIRSRASYFYTEWLRGQIKQAVREKEQSIVN